MGHGWWEGWDESAGRTCPWMVGGPGLAFVEVRALHSRFVYRCVRQWRPLEAMEPEWRRERQKTGIET